MREEIFYIPSLAADHLKEEIENGKELGNFQCNFEVPESLKANFAHFPPSLKYTLVSKNDIGDVMKTYA